MSTPLLIYLMGPTHSGKGTLIEAAKEKFGNFLGLVEVGKAFRAKYPPSYFEGQANPEHCRLEAKKLYDEFMEKLCNDSKIKYIIVDGQPREGQVEWALEERTNFQKLFVLLTAPVQIRRERIRERFYIYEDMPQSRRNEIAKNIDLAEKRLDNDRITYYEVLADLLVQNVTVLAFKTDVPKEQWIYRVLKYIECY